MDPHAVLPDDDDDDDGDGRQQEGRPHRQRAPPKYLQDYQTELYGRPPPPQTKACAEPGVETSDTALLRQEVAQLRSMVQELTGRVQQYEQSYSEGGSEEEFGIQSQESQAAYEWNQPVPTDTGAQCEKAQSEPNLTESVPVLNPGKISQSVQTLFPCVHKPSTLNVEREQKRPPSITFVRHEPEFRQQEPSSPLPSVSLVHVPPNPVTASYMPQSSVSRASESGLYVPVRSALSSDAPSTHMHEIRPPLSQPTPSMPPQMLPTHMPQASSSYAPPPQTYPTVPTLGAGIALAGYGLHSQWPPAQGTLPPSRAMQPPPIPTPQAPSASSRPSAYHPIYRNSPQSEFLATGGSCTANQETELYKFHILLDHLRLPSARHIALSYAHDPQPFTKALAALERQYGQPHQLALTEIQTLLNLPKLARGDAEGFQNFAVRRLLSKLPVELVSNFARHTRSASSNTHYNLVDFSAWLEGESELLNGGHHEDKLHQDISHNPKRGILVHTVSQPPITSQTVKA
ncbi:hypothetical protein JOB18_018190 [Solea senegalensis]|uniref:Uncharacterized protein n=1 Tax=Solea senegalensis TaxID=28829 RepID=A0AAV6Q610_SOLSE|nr:hypothetical protein JOB18_018190 [Solea senegalensis]